MNLENFIQYIAKFSDQSYEGVTRLPFTKESQQAFLSIMDTMKSLGLEVYSDKYGTIQGHFTGKSEESIIIASHYDSVVNGGKYDGMVGVAVGLAVVDYFVSNHIVPKYSIDVLALNDEEGVRFNKGFLSSKVVTETLQEVDVFDKETKTPLIDLVALNLYGSDTISLTTTLKNAKRYIEVHIEQGMILENNNLDIGLVENIVGINRYFITVKGSSGHAGTTPMEYRSDALVSATKLITDLQAIPKKYKDCVFTVGYMNVSPNAINVIPDTVVFSIDTRSPNIEDLKQIEKDIKQICNQNSNHSISIQRTTNIKPISLLNEQTTELKKSIENCSISYMPINSGAGHDSQIFSEFMPTSMLFVPSHLGYSHRPDEYTDIKYIEKSVEILCDFLK